MKHSHSLTILAAIAPFGIFTNTASAEREETIPIYNGTPNKVEWYLDKNGFGDALTGFVVFNLDGSRSGEAKWKVPAFDTKNGTRIVTGFRIDYGGTLQATFHADAGTTHNRKVEAYVANALITADINTDDNRNPGHKGYTASNFGYFGKEIPLAEQTSTLDWNLNLAVQEQGWTLRPVNFYSNKETFEKITKGETEVTLQGDVAWNPYFTFKRKAYGTNEIVTAYADAGTSQWEIPNENVADQLIGSAYPVDTLGRRIDAFFGLPGHSMGTQLDDRNAVYNKTGASAPINVSVVYSYTQVGDADYGLTVYGDAGKYAADFEKLDNHQTGSSSQTESLSFPGNKFLEYREFLLGYCAPYSLPPYPGNFSLYEDEGEISEGKNSFVYGLNATFNFKWMDVDRDNRVSMREYRNWRFTVDNLRAKHQAPGKFMADRDWATFPPPQDADAPQVPTLGWREEMLFSTIDKNNNGLVLAKEWLSLYPVLKAKPGTKVKVNPAYLQTFASVDTNNDKVVTREEILALGNSKMPFIWNSGIARIDLFVLMQGYVVDGKVTLLELRQAFNPGTSPLVIKKYLKKARNGNLKLPFNLADFLSWKNAPIKMFNVAQGIREVREEKLREIRKIYISHVTELEFATLFAPGTPQAKISAAWMIATGTQKGEKAPKYLSNAAFIECKLVGATIR